MTSSTSDPLPLEQLVRRLETFPERDMRAAELRRWLYFSAPEVVAEQLDALARGAAAGSPVYRVAHLAFVTLLLQPEPEDEVALAAVDLAAEAGGWRAAVWMLTDPEPHRHIDEQARKNRKVTGGMPLGTRIWKARLSDRRLLESLLSDPEPLVVEKLCENPRVSEAQILAVAARRPNWPDVLDVIARSRWLESARIREGLAQNPYGRTGLAIALLPILGPMFCARIRFSSDLHPRLLEAAEFFHQALGWPSP